MNINKLYLVFKIQLTCLLLISSVGFAQTYGVKKIVIDPGHGGKDPGAIGVTGLKEKDLVLKVALLTGEYIEKYLDGVEVLYTRDGDTYPTLKERCDFANKEKADLFISIHANAAAASQAYGSETFILGLTKSDNNLKVAQRENSVITFEDGYEETYQGFNPNSPESYIIFNFMQSAYQEQSTLLASLIQNQYRERVGRKDRQVQQGPFWVLSQTSMPAVLTELGFLSNATEERFLRSAQGQEYMASAIFRAVRDYKKEIDAKQSVTKDSTATQNIKTPEKEIDAKQSVTEDSTATQNIKTPEVKQETKPNVAYRLQIISSLKILKADHHSLKGLTDVDYYVDGKLFKYTLGNSTDLNEIRALKEKYNKHFNGCFIIALQDGKRITIEDAARLLTK